MSNTVSTPSAAPTSPAPTPSAAPTSPAPTPSAAPTSPALMLSAASDCITEQTAGRLASAVEGVGAVLLFLALVIACFHPWTKMAIEEALSITPLLLLVLIFVYVVNPIVEFLMHHIRRLPGSRLVSYNSSLIITYVLLLAVFIGVIATIAPKLVGEITVLADNFPIITQKVISIITEYRQEHLEAIPINLQQHLNELIGRVGSLAGQLISNALQYAGAISSTVAWMVTAIIMVPFISFYMLSEGRDLVNFWVDLLPNNRRSGVVDILIQLHVAMQSFIKGQALLCSAVGILTTILMAIVMPKYCIALGIIAGITEAIPIVGPFLGAVPAVFLALALPDGGIKLAIIVGLIYWGIQLVENNLLVPQIMGDTLGLHPLSLMIGMMVFANIFGFWGVVLASPIVAAVKIVVIHYCSPEKEAVLLEQIRQRRCECGAEK